MVLASMTILEKFDGTNFHTWKVKDEDGVVGQDFWSVVNT
jgi:hypothetical protein